MDSVDANRKDPVCVVQTQCRLSYGVDTEINRARLHTHTCMYVCMYVCM